MISHLVDLVRRFLRWWSLELIACIPTRWRDGFKGRKRGLRIDVHPDGLELRLGLDATASTLGFFATDASGTQRLKDTVRQLGRMDECRLMLPREAVLMRDTRLPLAALENLREVLGFEMDRHTPFRASEVFYDHRVTAVERETNSLLVAVGILPKQSVAEVLAFLTRAGLVPDRFGILDDPESEPWLINERAFMHLSGRAALARHMTTALAVLASALLVAALVLPIESKHRELEMLTAEIDQAKAKAMALEIGRAARIAAEERAGALLSERRLTFTRLSAMEELSRLLGDESWVLQLNANGGQISIAGYSANAAALIPLLEASPYFREVAFSAPVTADPRFKIERFTISLQLVDQAEAL